MSPDMPQQRVPTRVPKAVLWTVLVLLVTGVIGLSYYLYQKDIGNRNTNAGQNVNTAANQKANAGIDTSSWKTYTTSDKGFSIQYPPNYIIAASSAAGDAMSVRFTDEAFSNTEVSTPFVSIQELPLDGKSLSQWTESYLESSPSKAFDASQVAGYAATQFTINSGSNGTAILHPTNGTVVLVYTYHSGRSDVQQIGDAMIDSVAFN